MRTALILPTRVRMSRNLSRSVSHASADRISASRARANMASATAVATTPTVATAEKTATTTSPKQRLHPMCPLLSSPAL